MALDFPNSPSLDQEYTLDGRTWKWNGESWENITSVVTAGAGDVLVSGTPSDNQVAVWVSASEIEGSASFTWNGTTLGVTGIATVTGNLTVTSTTSLGNTTIAGSLSGVTSIDATTDTTITAAMPTADLTTSGFIEIATVAEANTGTDATRAVSPDALAGSVFGKKTVSVVVFDAISTCTTGDAAGGVFVRIPSACNGMNLVEVAACVYTAGTTGTMDIQIHNITDTTDMLSTKITIDSAETDSSTAATPAVINAALDDVVTGDKLRIDVDAVHTTPATGLVVELTFQLP